MTAISPISAPGQLSKVTPDPTPTEPPGAQKPKKNENKHAPAPQPTFNLAAELIMATFRAAKADIEARSVQVETDDETVARETVRIQSNRDVLANAALASLQQSSPERPGSGEVSEGDVALSNLKAAERELAEHRKAAEAREAERRETAEKPSPFAPAEPEAEDPFKAASEPTSPSGTLDPWVKQGVDSYRTTFSGDAAPTATSSWLA